MTTSNTHSTQPSTTVNAGRRIEIYDTTLRDGTQAEGISLTLSDKLRITEQLDSLGVDFVEGGYPLSNPKDVAYFSEVRKLSLKHAKVCAFGMTRRRGVVAKDDPGMQALVAAETPVIIIVGKTSDLHVEQVLGVSLQENLDMIQETLAFCKSAGREVFYDCEHFFDGYKANKAYALQTLEAALAGGASRLVLCDTNGGSLPSWVAQVVEELKTNLKDVATKYGRSVDNLIGIHTHNDSGLGVANALAAVEHGAVQVQGTINGIGERCGNVDLTTVAANLKLKMGYDCLQGNSIQRLVEVSRFVYEVANLNLVPYQPFVGSSAFAHKGGMHVHAVQKFPHSYEHVTPESVGNQRKILVSELSGASNIVATLGKKYNISDDKVLLRKVLGKVQDLENEGYQFEAAGASFELLLRKLRGDLPAFWTLDHYRCAILKREGEVAVTEATVKLSINGNCYHEVAEGDGPVNALDGALRKCLKAHYPQLANLHLTDYKVRVVNPNAESAAKVRVIAEFTPNLRNASSVKVSAFATTGVNENIVDASWEALNDAVRYYLLELDVKVPATEAMNTITTDVPAQVSTLK